MSGSQCQVTEFKDELNINIAPTNDNLNFLDWKKYLQNGIRGGIRKTKFRGYE